MADGPGEARALAPAEALTELRGLRRRRHARGVLPSEEIPVNVKLISCFSELVVSLNFFFLNKFFDHFF